MTYKTQAAKRWFRFNFALSRNQNAALEQVMKAGEYASMSEAIRDALARRAAQLGVAWPHDIEGQAYRGKG